MLGSVRLFDLRFEVVSRFPIFGKARSRVLEGQKCPRNVPMEIRQVAKARNQGSQAIEGEGVWVVARPGIEPGTQGFSVLMWLVCFCSELFRIALK